jgi:hypothetical protein
MQLSFPWQFPELKSLNDTCLPDRKHAFAAKSDHFGSFDICQMFKLPKFGLRLK